MQSFGLSSITLIGAIAAISIQFGYVIGIVIRELAARIDAELRRPVMPSIGAFHLRPLAVRQSPKRNPGAS